MLIISIIFKLTIYSLILPIFNILILNASILNLILLGLIAYGYFQSENKIKYVFKLLFILEFKEDTPEVTEQIYAWTTRDNIQSQNVLKKAGFDTFDGLENGMLNWEIMGISYSN